METRLLGAVQYADLSSACSKCNLVLGIRPPFPSPAAALVLVFEGGEVGVPHLRGKLLSHVRCRKACHKFYFPSSSSTHWVMHSVIMLKPKILGFFSYLSWLCGLRPIHKGMSSDISHHIMTVSKERSAWWVQRWYLCNNIDIIGNNKV